MEINDDFFFVQLEEKIIQVEHSEGWIYSRKKYFDVAVINFWSVEEAILM